MAESRALTAWEPTGSEFAPPGLTLTRRFYAWEIRGRGWHLWPHIVPLEPPFVPFRHELAPVSVRDDGRTPGFLDSIVALFARNTLPVPLVSVDLVSPEQEFATAPLEATLPDFVELHVAVPKTLFGSRETTEQFLLVTTAAGALGFEVIGTAGRIVVQLVATKRRASHVRQQLMGHFPGVVVQEAPAFLATAWQDSGEESVIVDFGLSSEFMRPIKTSGSFSPDPLVSVVAALESLGGREVGVLQVLLERTQHPWTESIVRAVAGPKGESFIADAPEMVALAREKTRGVLFAASVRVAAASSNETRSWRIVQGLGAALGSLAVPGSNELVPLTNDGFPHSVHEADLLQRTSHRCGMLLSSNELMALVHLPTPAVASRTLARVGKRTAPAPTAATRGDVILGTNSHEGVETQVRLTPEQRLQHVYVLGGSGTGKSTLLRNLIAQDIAAGRGVAVLDPHGDLVDDVMRYIPADRYADVILFDPADTERPVGFNVLQARTELEKTLLSSDLVALFRRFSTSWGDQMSTVLGNAVAAILESPKGGTLADLRHFLLDKSYRTEVLKEVGDPEVRYWWEKQYPALKGAPSASVLTRLDSFLRPKPIRHVVTQRNAGLDVGEVMSKGKILLAKLAQGLIGEENAHLLGSLIVSKFHQVAMARQAEMPEARRDFLLYIDEFHHFVSPSMAAILSGARKYHLGLTLAHQELRQVQDRDLAASILANACTRIMFRLGDEDARTMAQGLTVFEAKDLQNLDRGETIVRIGRAGDECNVATDAKVKVPDGRGSASDVVAIRQLSRRSFGRNVCEIEEALAAQYSAPSKAMPPITHGDEKAPSWTRGIAAQPADSPQTTAPPQARAPQPAAPSVRPTPTTSRSLAPPAPHEVAPLPGRGGPQHKTLQRMIKRMAEERGYKATIEAPLKNGGRVDVLLEREDHSVAVEVSVSTSPEHELDNLVKCLDAVTGQVVLVVSQTSSLSEFDLLLARTLPDGQRARVSLSSTDALLSTMDSLAPSSETPDNRVLGYVVTATHRINVEARQCQQSRPRVISDTVASAIHRQAR